MLEGRRDANVLLGCLLGILCLLLCPAGASAGRYDGGIPGSFLEFGSGARALGMGRAFSAVAEGPEALIWNPGGLGLPYRTAASFTHVRLYEGAALDELSVAHAFRRPIGVGMSIVSFSNGDFVGRDASNVETGPFRDSRRAVLFGWGVQPLGWLSVGFSHKFLRRQLADTSSSGFDTDVGFVARYRRVRGGFQIGNIMGAELDRDGGTDELPRTYRIGSAVTVVDPVLATFDVVTRAGVTDYRFGVEYSLFRSVAFRTGYDGAAPTFGASWRHKSMAFDYAISRHSVLGLSHLLTLRAGWGAPAEDKRLVRAKWRDEFYASAGARIKEFKDSRVERRDRKRTIAKYVEEGEEALTAGRFREANSYGNMALHLNPKSKKARKLVERAVVAERSAAMSAPEKPAVAPLAPGATAQAFIAEELDKLPKYKTSRKDAFAVIIGIEHYRDIVRADYASRDARKAKEYFEQALGIPPENIVIRLDDRASLSDFRMYLEGWLKEKVTADSEVFVFYSGHGTADPDSSNGYLVPYDASPVSFRLGGYPLSSLYESLGKLPMKRALVVLDACFSGAGGPRTVLARGTRPIVPIIEDPVLASGKIAVLSAASGSQITGTLEEKQHGLLTYYLLRGLQGEADTDKDKSISLVELYSYLLPKVIVEARKSHREQEPKLLPAIEVADPWGDEPLAVLE
ncbi:caspase family protein [Elusimicrobiota bacterium]